MQPSRGRHLASCCSCCPWCWDVPEEIPDWDRCWPCLLPATSLLLISTGGALDGEEEHNGSRSSVTAVLWGREKITFHLQREVGEITQHSVVPALSGHWCQTSLCDFPGGLALTHCWWDRRVPGGAATPHYPRITPRREAAASPIASSPACSQAQARKCPVSLWKGMRNCWPGSFPRRWTAGTNLAVLPLLPFGRSPGVPPLAQAKRNR